MVKGEGLRRIRLFITLITGVAILCLSSISIAEKTRSIHVRQGASAYAKTLQTLLGSSEVSTLPNESLLPTLAKSAAIQAYHVQAEPLLSSGAASHFYPHYVDTVVIAIDRQQTDMQIGGWEALRQSGLPVSISNEMPKKVYLWAAVSFGLTGRYETKAALDFFLALQDAGLSLSDATDRPYPVRIALESEVPIGWEIIIPQEGTLCLDVGLLSSRPLEGDHDEIRASLAGQGFRQTPHANAAYADAAALNNFKSIDAVIRREIQRIRLFASADFEEHHLAALLAIALITLWIYSMRIRTIAPQTRLMITIIGAMQIAWLIIRDIKYLLSGYGGVSNYLWYAFYIFQIFIPILFLSLAVTLGGYGHDRKYRRGFMVLSFAGSLLVGLVFTNELHHLVFQLPPGYGGGPDYAYGIGYYAVFAFCSLLTVSSVAVLAHKARKAPRRRGAILTSITLLGLLAYAAGYAMHIPFFVESDMTLVACLVILLFLEAAFQTGFIPVNQGYRALFAKLPLGMQLLNGDGAAVMRTMDALALEDKATKALLWADGGAGVAQGDDTMLYATSIPGGFAVWQKDVSELNRLHRALEEASATLEKQHRQMTEQKEIEGRLAALRQQNELYEMIEGAISQKLHKMENRILALEGLRDHPARYARSIAAINLLACAIKRECAMLLGGMEEKIISGGALWSSLEELMETAGASGLMCQALPPQLRGCVSARNGRLMYSYACLLIECALDQGRGTLLTRLFAEQGDMCLLFMPDSALASTLEISALECLVRAADGSLQKKQLDDTQSVLLRFPLGGDGHA